MDPHGPSNTDSGPSAHNVTEVHNPSVDQDAADGGACAQVHLPTGAMCVMRHGHEGLGEFSPAGEAETLLAARKTAEHW